MKTTADYDSMTDETLSMLIARQVIGDELELRDCPTGQGMRYMYKITPKDGKSFFSPDMLISYATSLDACREAIEKFCKGKYMLDLQFWMDRRWRAMFIRHADIESDFIAIHENPARACCIAMLVALEEEK